MRQVSRMRSKIGPFTLKRLAHEAGIAGNVSMSTISRALRKHGFQYLHSRRKGIMEPTDFTKQIKFARTALKYPMDFWTKNMNFYLDGTGFTHKLNHMMKLALQKRLVGGKNLKVWIFYALLKVNELLLVVRWHTLWQPYHLDARLFYMTNTKVVWMVSGLHQWYVNFSQMCTRKLNSAKDVCFCRTGVQCKTKLLLWRPWKKSKHMYFQFHPVFLILTQ